MGNAAALQPVGTSSHLSPVLDAIKRQKKHEVLATNAMRDRDDGIRKMKADGMTCPAIARATGLSTSLVRILTR